MATLLSMLKAPEGANKRRKRVGRGDGSGHGGTSCRGHKGHKARSGGSTPPGFEGGQMPLHRRLPKRGFRNRFRVEYSIVNVGSLNCFSEGEIVDPEALRRKGLIRNLKRKVKILGDGEVSVSLTVKAHRFSGSARSKIEAAGGKVEVI